MTALHSASSGVTLGEVLFVSSSDSERLLAEAAQADLLAVRLPEPGARERGNLGLLVEASIDEALARLGAAPPGVGASVNLDASLSDQLYRARLVGRRGLVLSLPNLGGLSDVDGALDTDDGRALRWWAAAVQERPLQLLVDEANARLGMYPPAVPAASLLLGTSSAPVLAEGEATAPQVAPAWASSLQAMTEAASPSPAEPRAVEQATVQYTAPEEWPEWVRELAATRGPKPLSVIERLFASSYVPLSEAVMRGLDDASAIEALQSWATGFERSYREAFETLRHRGKRPTMVWDVADIAVRLGRLHGARSTQMVLVDGMRFDLGLRLQQRLQASLSGRVTLAERLMLWSALPSTTAVQLELIGRGAAGLKDFDASGAQPSDAIVARGRHAAMLRRVKAGHRELLKLDIVEARLDVPGSPADRRLDEIAAELSLTLTEYLGKLPARTLVLVFGDHGFRLEPFDGGTAAEQHGGASPEEVLVLGLAWLTGDVH